MGILLIRGSPFLYKKKHIMEYKEPIIIRDKTLYSNSFDHSEVEKYSPVKINRVVKQFSNRPMPSNLEEALDDMEELHYLKNNYPNLDNWSNDFIDETRERIFEYLKPGASIKVECDGATYSKDIEGNIDYVVD